jgi:hypothetical protein
MASALPNLIYRMVEAERRLGRVEERTEDVRILRAEYGHLSGRITELTDEVRALRRAVVTAAISFAASAVLIAITTILAFQ